jgi:hypothetical protein
MGTASKRERLAAAMVAVTVSLSILAGMNSLADRYVREGLDSAPGKLIACLRSLA